MNFTRLTGLRDIARQLGITKLLSFRSTIANNKARKYYEMHKPAAASISLLGYSYQLNTGSAYEWMRANAVYQDKHILEKLLSHLDAGMNCWDIGASIGAYSCILSLKNKPNGIVYAFEPEHSSRQKLNANLQLNNISNVQIYDLALGSEEKQLHLVLAHDASAGTHRLDQGDSITSGESQVVHVTTIDKLIERDHLKIPGVIKIDVEGFEEQVLIGGKNTIRDQACRAIMIEMHFSIFAQQKDNNRANRIAEILKQAGFTKQDWIDPSHLFATK
jgi:FkbM family methyltransferase